MKILGTVAMLDEVVETCNEAVEVWGDEQIGVCMEECAELIQALSKCWRLRKGQPVRGLTAEGIRDNVIEEMTDVIIMIEQIQKLLDIHPVEVWASMGKKADRLKEVIAKIKEDKN